MSRIYLCGHTGSRNRGCDAIIRSTAGILKQLNMGVSAMTFREDQDRLVGLDRCVTLIPYPKKPLPVRAAGLLRRKLTGDSVFGKRYFYKELIRKVSEGDILFNVGGDTYCYGKPNLSYALNEMAQEKGIDTVFWGCSLDKGLLDDPQMLADVNRYRWIVARETMSYEMFVSRVADPSRVLLACDPAFALQPEEVPLPENFLPKQTLGLNISPLVFADSQDDSDIMYRNLYCLIDHVLASSDLHICLIPHVYHAEENLEDIRILRHIRRKYADNPRISLVEQEYSSAQLKYIISQCRFFIGARTHSMIAAYSSGVPALALSYSQKSLGIAKDLFGTTEGYAISWRQFREDGQLLDAFEQLRSRETELLSLYERLLPEYRARIFEAAKIVTGR